MSNPFQTDLRQLAVGVLYLNLGRADVDFPTTTPSHPSYAVHVTLIPPLTVLDASHTHLFPFFVLWGRWQKVVVPLFEDGSVLVKVLGGTNETLRQQINKEMLPGDLEGLLVKIEQALLRGLIDEGYMPPSATTTEYEVTADGPLVYKTEAELVAEAQTLAAAEQAQAVWEAAMAESPPVSAVVPMPTAPDLTTPYQVNQDQVVLPPVAPGEPIVPPGTGDGSPYQRFDE